MTTTICPSSSVDRISQLVLLLSSPIDGEVVAAARAIGRVLTAESCDWHDLARGIRAAPAPASDANHWSGWHWCSAAEWCARHSEYLNEWEQDFIDNILGWRRSPTQKQLDCLESIRQRILRRQSK
jgi:hypothetical protein